MVTSRVRFTAQQSVELLKLWKNGLSVAAISRALKRRNKTGIQRIVVPSWRHHAGATAVKRGAKYDSIYAKRKSNQPPSRCPLEMMPDPISRWTSILLSR